MKGIKTTIVAIIGGVLGLAIFTFWLLGKIDNTGLGIGLSSVATFTSMIGLSLTKDYDQSHTKN